MLGVQQYTDANNGIIFLATTDYQPSYSAVLRIGKYVPANPKVFQCSKADGLAYLKNAGTTKGNIAKGTRYYGRSGTDHYAVDNWRELAVCDAMAYTVNYKGRHHNGNPGENFVEDVYNKSIKILNQKDTNNSRSLICSKVKSPSTYMFNIDGKRQDGNAHHMTLWYSPKSWAGAPWAVHSSDKANAGWLDGHVEFADNAKLRSHVWGAKPEGNEAAIEWQM